MKCWCANGTYHFVMDCRGCWIVEGEHPSWYRPPVTQIVILRKEKKPHNVHEIGYISVLDDIILHVFPHPTERLLWTTV